MNEEKVKALLITIGELVWEKGVLMSPGGEFHCPQCRKIFDLLKRESPYTSEDHHKTVQILREIERMRKDCGT